MVEVDRLVGEVQGCQGAGRQVRLHVLDWTTAVRTTLLKCICESYIYDSKHPYLSTEVLYPQLSLPPSLLLTDPCVTTPLS